jgi:hypothetical protein
LVFLFGTIVFLPDQRKRRAHFRKFLIISRGQRVPHQFSSRTYATRFFIRSAALLRAK